PAFQPGVVPGIVMPGSTPPPIPQAALSPATPPPVVTPPPVTPPPTPVPEVAAAPIVPAPQRAPATAALPAVVLPLSAYDPTPPPDALMPAPVSEPIAMSPAMSSHDAAALLETPLPVVPIEVVVTPGPVTAPPAVEFEDPDAGAIPSEPLPDADSGANISPLAHTLAMAEAARQTTAEPDDEVTGDDVEVVDAAAGVPEPMPAPQPRRSIPPPPPTAATPPPIPVLRTRSSPELLSSLPIPEALAQRPRRPKRAKPWFEEIFDEDYLRTLPFVSAEQTLKESSFIEAALVPVAGAEILDVGCGYGRHAIELGHRGFKLTGLDLSLPLLMRAADDAQRRAVSVNFVHADMREMAFDRQFDGAYSLMTSFGFFDEDANLRVAEGVAKALKPGGRFLLDVINRDYVVGDLPTRIWWEGVGCVVLEEVDFNFHTSRIMTRRSVVFEDGRQLEQEMSVRAYSLHEVGRLLRQAGFRVIDISGSLSTRGQFFGSSSRNLLILSEKRTDDR
ncbi:MAG TPA: methyltransferase domain-containing protein, partial [Vicinamibacterales bacterium]